MPRTEKQNKEIREKARTAILTSALKLFSRKGYHGTTMNDIAAEAKISKGLTYNYFESKQQIAEAIIDSLREIGSLVENELKKSDDPYEQLKILIISTFDFLSQNEEYWRMYITFTLQQDIYEMTKTRASKFFEFLWLEIEKIFKRIGFKNYAIESRIFGAELDGICLHYFMNKENYPLKKVTQFMVTKYSKKNLDLLKNQ